VRAVDLLTLAQPIVQWISAAVNGAAGISSERR